MCHTFTGFATKGLIDPKAPDYAGQAQAAENQRQQLINQGMVSINKAYGGYNQDFYNQRAQSYVNFAMPQLATQAQATQSAIGFGLANRGLFGGSSQAKKANQDFSRQYGQAEQQISDTGRGQAQALQQQIEGSRNTAINQLYQSADPAAATRQATSTAAGYQIPQPFVPISNMFSNLINQYYYNQLLNAYRPQTGAAAGSGYLPPESNPTARALPGVTL